MDPSGLEKNNCPLVSICIPVYNTVNYIEETISCFLNQTHSNIEIIVQDDCSTDGTWELVKEKFSHNKKVKLFRNSKNLGIGDNWNEAYAKSTGDYIVIANADDILFANFLEIGLMPFKNEPYIDIVYCGFELFYQHTKKVERPSIQYKIEPGIQADSFKVNFFQNPFSWVFGIARRSILEKSKLTDGRLFLNTQICDSELRWRTSKVGAVVFYLPDVIGYYRRHENNVSTKRYGEKYSYFEILENYNSFIKKKYKKLYFNRRLWQVKLIIKDFIRQPKGFSFRLFFTSIAYLFK